MVDNLPDLLPDNHYLLNAIMSTTVEGILLLDSSEQILFINPSLAQYLKIPDGVYYHLTFRSSLPGKSASLMELCGYNESGWDVSCHEITSGRAKLIKEEVKIKGSQALYLSRTQLPILDRQGQISGWLLIFRDVTKDYKLSRLREEMTHLFIHDLRSPLTTLASSLSMLKTLLTEGNRADVEEIIDLSQRGTERMLGLVNELLEINKLENGQEPIQLQPIELKPLLEEITDQLIPLARDAEIEVKVDIQPDLPKILADAPQLGRVFNNLLDNAIKFTPNGGHVSLWSCLDPENPDSYLLMGVNDDGPGIPVEAQPRIFEKFQRVTTIKGRRLGTGLGLAFCRLAVEAHGGCIWVESQEGSGSKFIVRLPIPPNGLN